MIASEVFLFILQFAGELKVIFSDAWINCCVLGLIMASWITNVTLSCLSRREMFNKLSEEAYFSPTQWNVLWLKWSGDIVLQVAMCLLSGHHLYSVTTTPGTPGLQPSHWPPVLHVGFWLAEMARCLWPLYGVTTQLWTYLLSQVISSIII